MLQGTQARRQTSKSDVLAIYEKLKASIEAWENSKDERLLVNWRGAVVRVVSQELEDSFIELGKFLNSSDFKEDARRLVLALDRFVDAVFDWAEQLHQDTGKSSPQGSPEMWSAWQLVPRAMVEPRYGKVEPIRQLLAEKVERTQICKIWGFVDETGRPDLNRLEEEIESPGKHTRNWEHPDAKRAREELQARWQERSDWIQNRDRDDEIDRAFSEPDKRRDWAEPDDAPESIGELLSLPGITIQQVARIKGLSMEEVRQAAVELRIPVDAEIAAEIANLNLKSREDHLRVATDPEGLRLQIERQTELQVSRIATYKELGGLDVRVLAIADDGISVGKIVLALRDEFPELTYERVASIIDRRSEIVDATVKAEDRKRSKEQRKAGKQDSEPAASE